MFMNSRPLRRSALSVTIMPIRKCLAWCINGPILVFLNPMSRGRGPRIGEGGTCVAGPKGRDESRRRRPANNMPRSLAFLDARTPVPSDGSRTSECNPLSSGWFGGQTQFVS